MKPSDILPDGPHYDLKRHLAHVKHLWKKYPYRGPHACAERAADLVVEAGYQTPFGEELAAMVARLLDDDIFITHEPTLEYAPYLTRMQKRLTLRYDDAFLAIKEFLRELQPLIPTEPGLATIPLHTIFQPHTFIGTVYRCFHDVTSDGEYLFDDLRRQLYRNLITASGYDPGTYDGKRKLVVPAESRDAPEDVYRKYLANTPFLDILDFPVPFAIPIDSYREHGFLFAKSGHGKSQSMRAMLSSLLDQDCALFVIDGNGALIENLDRVESIKDRLVVLDPTETPALNFFKMQGASREKQMELFFYLFRAIDQSLTERQATMVAYLVDLMQAIPDATFDTLRQVCEAKTFPYVDVLKQLPPITQDFFAHQFMGSDQLVRQTKNQLAQRLYTVGRNHAFAAMFSARDNRFNAFECMQQKKVVIVDTSRDKLGDQGSAIFGRYILAQCLAAAWQRPKHERHLCLLMVDEAKTYLDDQSQKILSDARAFGLGLLLASQFPDQLDEGVRKEVVNNTSIKLAGPAAYSVVAQLNRDMRCEADFILGMKKKDYAYAEWACYVDNVTPRAVKITVPFGAIEKLPQISAAQWRELRAANRKRYGAAPPPRRDEPSVPQMQPATPGRSSTKEKTDEPRVTPKKSTERKPHRSGEIERYTDH